MPLVWRPTLCILCGKLPAIMGSFEGDNAEPELLFCWSCGTPCGDDCCGVYIRYGLAERICALWALLTDREVYSIDLGTFPAPAPSAATA